MNTLVLVIAWVVPLNSIQAHFEPCTNEIFVITNNREALLEDYPYVYVVTDKSTPVFVHAEPQIRFTEKHARCDKETPVT
jgi:hypothetical protein